MTQEVLKLSQEALTGLKDVEKQVRELVAENRALKEALAQTQEPVAWGVDWGKDGDIPCVSIIKRLPNDVIEVVAVEYAPYSYTHPPQRSESSGKPSAWVGLTNNELQPIADEYRILFGGWVEDFARAIEAKLKEKNT